MSERDDRIPVTVVSGYLGAGKTTLINNVLADPQGHQVAVIVNDMGEVNIDAELIARESESEGIIDLSNGCICCRLQGDLLAEADRLAERREFDYLLVESSGISEPVPVARVFLEGTDASDIDPTERFRLDTLVTVLDTYGFWKALDVEESLPEHAGGDGDGDGGSGGSSEPAPERPLTEVFIEGIEFCDVLLVNKCDMVPEDVLEELEAVIEELQPRAERVRTVECDVDPGLVLDTGRFDFEAATRSQGWKRRLRESGEGRGDVDEGHDHDHDHDHSQGHGHEHDETHSHDHPTTADRHGISSFVFRADRPFDPHRLADWLTDWEESIVRAKGVCHVAGSDDVIGVSQAGPAVRAGPIGQWGPKEERKTQLVFIGRELDESTIRADLEALLLESDSEVAKTADGPAPFPLRS